MDNDEKELLKKFRVLTPENRVIALSNVCVAMAVQENTKRQYGIPQTTGEARADRELAAQASKSA
jgi:hypothetical protein